MQESVSSNVKVPEKGNLIYRTTEGVEGDDEGTTDERWRREVMV